MTWAARLYHDGQPVTDAVPINTWEAATLIAPLAVALGGGPVSVALAVFEAQRVDEPEPDPDIFDALADLEPA